jgi:IclR family KDG regulon transcriptional repressor
MNNTLHKGLRLLEIMARSQRPIGITEMARRTSLGKSDVHRLMQSLVELGFARRESAQGSYAASTKVWELGMAMLANDEVRRAALPQMQHLAQASRETVHLTVLDGVDAVHLHGIDGPDPSPAQIPVGTRLPAHCTATGKAMLSTLDDESLDALPLTLARLTDETITEPSRLFRELHLAREAGYAVERGEHHAQVRGVGAAVVAGSGLVAGLEIVGPADRLDPARLEALGAMVRDAARTVAAELARPPVAPTAGPAAGAKRRVGRPLAPPPVERVATWPSPSAMPASTLTPSTPRPHPPVGLESADH